MLRATPPRGVPSASRRLLRVALLHRKCALDAREVLAHETAERGRSVAVTVEPGAGRVAQGDVRERRGVEARDQVARDLVRRGSTRRGAASRSNRSTKARRARPCLRGGRARAPPSGRPCWAGPTSRSSDDQAARLASTVGSAALACAANSPPFAVLSAASAASISAASTVPPAASETRSAHDRSVVDREALEATLAVAQRAHGLPLRGGRGGRSERRHELQLAVAAGLGRLRELHSPSATFSRVASRFSGAT